MSQLAYIYLLQDGNDRNTNIYKVGRTTQYGEDSRKLRRLQQYAKGTVVFNTFFVDVDQVKNIEQNILSKFQQKYRLARGFEWFEGDVTEMKKDIDVIIERMMKSVEHLPVEDPHMCPSCGKQFSNTSNKTAHIRMGRCKGTANPLQCGKCMMIFPHATAKCRHKAVCAGHVPSLMEEPSLVHNNVFNDDGNTFVYDHIQCDSLIRMVEQSKNNIYRFLSSFLKELCLNPFNRIVRKKHITTSICDVRTGADNWEVRPDISVFQRLCKDIAMTAQEVIDLCSTDVFEFNDIRSQLIDMDPTKIKKCTQEMKLVIHNMTRAGQL
jgi:hypothetical protein